MPVRKIIKIYIKVHFPHTHIPILNLVHTPTHTLTRMSTHMLSVLRLLPTAPGLTWAHPGNWSPVGPGMFGSRDWHRRHSATRRWGRQPLRAWHLERQPPPRLWTEAEHQSPAFPQLSPCLPCPVVRTRDYRQEKSEARHRRWHS